MSTTAGTTWWLMLCKKACQSDMWHSDWGNMPGMHPVTEYTSRKAVVRYPAGMHARGIWLHQLAACHVWAIC